MPEYMFINSSKSFENCLILETGTSDFYKLIVTAMKNKHESFPPKTTKDYKNFNTNVL